MSELVSTAVAEVLGRGVPMCEWVFNQQHRFEYLGGDSEKLFRHPPDKLLHAHVTLIDDPSGSWAARLGRMFSGIARVERWEAPGPEVGYSLTHLPIRGADRQVMYAAGFAYSAAEAAPAESELELIALSILRVLRTERARTSRFLHDVVAQCLSVTGLQLELLRLEIEVQKVTPPARIADMQRSLEEALALVRNPSGEEYSALRLKNHA